jgi:hypothetical protein
MIFFMGRWEMVRKGGWEERSCCVAGRRFNVLDHSKDLLRRTQSIFGSLGDLEQLGLFGKEAEWGDGRAIIGQISKKAASCIFDEPEAKRRHASVAHASGSSRFP